MTRKLYDENSYLSTFDAVVLSCDSTGEDTYKIVLDQTAFFPEGGGQPADTGTLADVNVTDVQDLNGIIVHTTDASLAPGTVVCGSIDWTKRFRRMQEHTGEHILSGLVHRLYGYQNVGFHLGEQAVTMDYDGELSQEQINELEMLANQAVWENVPVRAEYPSESVLQTLDYRSKLDLKENVRIVTIEGYDVCACCAPHVSHTGEIGSIKIIDSMRHRGGVRLTILCGCDALAHYQLLFHESSALSVLLNAPKEQLVPAVERLFQERDALQLTLKQREEKLSTMRLQSLPESADNIIVFDAFDDAETMRDLVNAGMERARGVCAAFTGDDANGYRYIIGSRNVDLRSSAKEINEALHGRGGGRPTMIQGSCLACRRQIEDFFQKFQR